ncbi:hypothetical protein [Martelella endophytica]|uniref:Uncharacterized protein n=1 Tax=Martelella endophytica TaxID=1486262 RepID=A0A0D5LQI0_MAREN|nr:hypothetical protein [Martelella endophytica]AJY46022.1 hypothetical protein TM49_10635 [Martelella endophytica]
MFEYLPLIAFQIVFAAAGLAILYRMIGGKLFASTEPSSETLRREMFRRSAQNSNHGSSQAA